MKVGASLGLLATFLFIQGVNAQEQNFRVVPLPDGKMKLEAVGGPQGGGSSDDSGKSTTDLPSKQGTLTLDQGLKDALKNQEWFVQRSESGEPKAVFSFPAGTEPPNTMLAGLKPGETVQKVASISWVTKLAPSTEQMTEILEDLLTKTRNAVCTMSMRPKTFATQVDISAGIGLQGKIAFNASWETADLCR